MAYADKAKEMRGIHLAKRRAYDALPHIRAKRHAYNASPHGRALAKRRYDRNRAKMLAQMKAATDRKKEQLGKEGWSRYIASVTLKTRYGITLEEKEQMMLDQGNKCLICNIKFTDCFNCNTTPAVDHCHITGSIRGILCNKCNRGLGCYDDSISLHASAARYLYKHKL